MDSLTDAEKYSYLTNDYKSREYAVNNNKVFIFMKMTIVQITVERYME